MSTMLLLQSLRIGYKYILKDNLVGIYLHGSIVLGSYNPNVSDLDYIVVVKKPLSVADKQVLLHFSLNELLPLSPGKGLEFSVVLLEDTQHFIYPTPFDFHFSKFHYETAVANPAAYLNEMIGTDTDLATHFYLINQQGRVLTGLPINQVFEPVPAKYCWQSITHYMFNAKQDIVVDPTYVILNICRTLAFKEEQRVLSKLQGGRWGLAHLPKKYHGLIQQALSNYQVRTAQDIKNNYDESLAARFAEEMINKIPVLVQEKNLQDV